LADFFGFEIKKKDQEKDDRTRASFVAPMDEDEGIGNVINAGGHFGQYVDINGDQTKSEKELILKYRDISQHTECDAAVEDIVNEAIVSDDDSSPVSLIMNDLDQPDRIKKMINEEFEHVVSMLNMNWYGHDIFRRWYVDGRLYYHKIIDEANPKNGLIELRSIDPTKIRKVRELKKEKDPKTGAEIIVGSTEYFIFQNESLGSKAQGLKIAKDAVAYVTSGLLDPSRKKILSHLHKALKPVNQLRMMEDSLVIYRLARAPERRIFYIDVGNLPKGKAEEYLRNIMAKYRNKMVYDAETGDMKDDKKHMSMLEDFWLPRREGGRGTEISTLPGGENLGQIDDIEYFRRKLYKSLNVPSGRLEQEQQFNLGRSTEISRDELKFQKFINRLRKKFSALFIDILKTQLILKGIVTNEEWEDIRSDISVDFLKDNHFSELKDAELLRERLGTLREIDEYAGRYYSVEWIRKNVLMQNDEDIEDIIKQIDAEGMNDTEEEV
jgi:hypothetical protein|tara:strand:- start:1450 stop:2937 length:1488 start_codon:yes stop_codon:yes gene_type:complete